jgi:hypothetical protein
MKNINIIIVFLLLFGIKVNAQVVLPTGGVSLEEWVHNNEVSITWMRGLVTDSIHNEIKIELWNAGNNETIVIANNIQDTLGVYFWTIPDTIDAGNKYKIRILNSDSTQFNMISEDFIEISEEPSPLLTIENTKENNEINLFPNPTRNEFNLISELDISELYITDILGNKVYNIQNLNSKVFKYSDSQLSQGSYFVVIKTQDNNLQTLKFIVE